MSVPAWGRSSAALIASDHVVVPVSPDLFSLQGLRNLGPTLYGWRSGWRERLDKLHNRSRPLPTGNTTPLGYVVLGHGVRLKPADGAFGGHTQAAQRAYDDFRELAIRILTASQAAA